MKPIRFNSFRIVLPLASLINLVHPAAAADRWWDAGTTNLGTAGDGVSVFASGTWNTTTTNWDQGAGLAHGARNNAAAPLDNAVFSGPGVSGTGSVALRKTGAGTFTLTNANLYTGATTLFGLLGTASILSAAVSITADFNDNVANGFVRFNDTAIGNANRSGATLGQGNGG